jgi:hypothetical protein
MCWELPDVCYYYRKLGMLIVSSFRSDSCLSSPTLAALVKCNMRISLLFNGQYMVIRHKYFYRVIRAGKAAFIYNS